MDSTPDKPKKVRFWSVALSVVAAAFGVQSKTNHSRDFQQRSIWPFIVGGVVFTVLFVVTLIVIVKIVLAT